MTKAKRHEQEYRDHHLLSRLLSWKDPFLNVSKHKTLIVMGRKLPLRWILLYAHARTEGIVCMYMASLYAWWMLDYDPFLPDKEVDNRKLDARLLWFFHRHKLKHGLYQNPGQKS